MPAGTGKISRQQWRRDLVWRCVAAVVALACWALLSWALVTGFGVRH
ncbi:MAG: hypothetical protein ACE5IP_11345 [Terriglobia bacterium]